MNIGRMIADAAGNTVVILFVFFIAFPFVAPLVLRGLRLVLEGLNSFGSGM